MAKLALLLAAFTVLLLVANASIYRTTVEIDDENPRQQSCQEQIQRQQQLRHCQMHLQQEVQGGRRERWLNPDNQREQHLRECCRQLEQLDNRCRCQGLEQAVRSQQQQGQFRGEEVRELYDTAYEIPRRCNIEPRQGCQFRSPYWSV